jgi:hypothetical protein
LSVLLGKGRLFWYIIGERKKKKKRKHGGAQETQGDGMKKKKSKESLRQRLERRQGEQTARAQDKYGMTAAEREILSNTCLGCDFLDDDCLCIKTGKPRTTEDTRCNQYIEWQPPLWDRDDIDDGTKIGIARERLRAIVDPAKRAAQNYGMATQTNSGFVRDANDGVKRIQELVKDLARD